MQSRVTVIGSGFLFIFCLIASWPQKVNNLCSKFNSCLAPKQERYRVLHLLLLQARNNNPFTSIFLSSFLSFLPFLCLCEFFYFLHFNSFFHFLRTCFQFQIIVFIVSLIYFSYFFTLFSYFSSYWCLQNILLYHFSPYIHLSACLSFYT